jgi:hypothetical protein
MIKRNRFYLLLAVLLILLAVWLYFSQRGGTFNRELKDFAIEDSSRVSKIFMVNKANTQVLLERTDSGWVVNGKLPARKDGIETLLKTMLRIQVKSPVPKTVFETVVRNLATQSTKVEVYIDNEDEPEKVFFVGGSTPDNLGTYMLMDKSTVPFIMYIPGFSGFLTSRFFIDEILWINPQIFNYSYNDIRSVSLELIDQPSRSFQITNLGSGKVKLKSLYNNTEISDFDSLSVREYIGMYKKISFETVVTGLSKVKRDSILASKPVHRIKVTDTKNKTTVINTFLRPPNGLADENGQAYPFDVERMNANI